MSQTIVSRPNGTIFLSDSAGQSLFINSLYIPDSSGNAVLQAQINNLVSPPTAPGGTLEFTRRTWWNDSGTLMPAGRNNFIDIFHVWGEGGVQTPGTNGAAFAVFSRNTGLTQNFGGSGQLVTGYFENVMTGAPILPAGPEPAMSALRATIQDARTGGALSGGSGGIWAFSTNAELSTNGAYGCGAGGCFGAIRASVTAGSTPVATGNHGFDIISSINVDGGYGASTATNLGWSGLIINAPVSGIRFPYVNYGIWIKSFGNANANDANIRSDGDMATFSGQNVFTGPVVLTNLTPASTSAAGLKGTITWDANFFYGCVATNKWGRVAWDFNF